MSDLSNPARHAASPGRNRRRKLRSKPRTGLSRGLPTLPIDELWPALIAELCLPVPLDAELFIRAYGRYKWLRIVFRRYDMGDAKVYAWCAHLSRWQAGYDYLVYTRTVTEASLRHVEWGKWHEASHIVYLDLAVGESSKRGEDLKTARERRAEDVAAFMSLYARGEAQSGQHLDDDFRTLYDDMGW